MQTEQSRKFIFAGMIGLLVLIIGGLIWAVIALPSSSDRPAESLQFTDTDDPTRGPSDAKVVVRIFGDFQCPACKSAEAGVKYAMNAYKDTVRFVWNDFPLMPIHKWARPAANAARCAEEQGKFWEYHDKLYDRQEEWGGERTDAPDALFQTYAKELSLDESAFRACVTSSKYDNKISQDEREGRLNRVQATPTFFVNNLRFEGAIRTEEWDQSIQGQLTNGS